MVTPAASDKAVPGVCESVVAANLPTRAPLDNPRGGTSLRHMNLLNLMRATKGKDDVEGAFRFGASLQVALGPWDLVLSLSRRVSRSALPPPDSLRDGSSVTRP